MARPILKRTKKALMLLETIHPLYPHRLYTVFEAATKTGTPLSTIYRHLKIAEEKAKNHDAIPSTADSANTGALGDTGGEA